MRIRELSELGACRVPELRQMQPCTPALGVLLSRERTGSQPTSESTALLPSLHLETPEHHIELLLALRSS